MRRLRHPCPRTRRRAHRLLRPVRASAPRAGVGGHRRLRPRPDDDAARHGPRDAGVQRGEAARPARRDRDRARALLDNGLDALVERAAGRAPRSRAHSRARSQRQPHERRGAPRRASSPGRARVLYLRQRADRRAGRDGRGAAHRRRRECDAKARGRVLVRGAGRGEAARLPRSARLPSAGARPHRRRLARRVRNLRARPCWSGLRKRRRARRSRPDRRRRPDHCAGRRAGGTTARSASSSSSTSRGRTRGSPGSRSTPRACAWASGSPRKRRPTPTS